MAASHLCVPEIVFRRIAPIQSKQVPAGNPLVILQLDANLRVLMMLPNSTAHVGRVAVPKLKPIKRIVRVLCITHQIVNWNPIVAAPILGHDMKHETAARDRDGAKDFAEDVLLGRSIGQLIVQEVALEIHPELRNLNVWVHNSSISAPWSHSLQIQNSLY